MLLQRGEIWLVDFDPQIGSEIKKQRPALILTENVLQKLPVVTVLPVRERKDTHKGQFYLVQVLSAKGNGIKKTSSIDCFQIKSFSKERCIRRLGVLGKSELEEVEYAVRLTLGL